MAVGVMHWPWESPLSPIRPKAASCLQLPTLDAFHGLLRRDVLVLPGLWSGFVATLSQTESFAEGAKLLFPGIPAS